MNGEKINKYDIILILSALIIHYTLKESCVMLLHKIMAKGNTHPKKDVKKKKKVK